MFHWKKWAILLAVVALSLFGGGCRKVEKEQPLSKSPSREKPEKRRTIAKNACEETVRDFLDAVATHDYKAAVEFVDIEEMLREAQAKALTSSTIPPVDADEMNEKLRAMMENMAKLQKGELSYGILGSQVSGGKATVQVEVYRDGELADTASYTLTKRGDRWKLSSGAAIRPLMPFISKGKPAEQPGAK